MSATRFSLLVGKICQRTRQGGLVPCLVAAVVVWVFSAGVVPAQQSKPANKTEDEQLPPREELGGSELMTKDGVQLKATFYPGTNGKETVPVILLHMWKGDRRDYAKLVPLLRKQGHAVLVPDLRGHGESTQVIVGNRPQQLDAAKMPAEQFSLMVEEDMETLKSFLMKENNAGKLNIDKLCVVGAEMGASVALNWAWYDWHWPDLVGKRQGRDVKALVLLSPQWSFPGLPLRKALSHPAVRSRISIMIVVGEGDQRTLSDAQRLESFLSRYHPEQSETSKKTLVLIKSNTKLQGTKMLGVKGLNTGRFIDAFILNRAANQPYPWRER